MKGIGLITLVWTDGVNTSPFDYRIYDKDGDEMSKNDYFRQMVTTAAARGFQPCFIMFDSWYSGIDNLKCVTKLYWNWCSHIKKNIMVNPDDTENRPVSDLEIPDNGMTVHMKKYGVIPVFHTVNKNGKKQVLGLQFPDHGPSGQDEPSGYLLVRRELFPRSQGIIFCRGLENPKRGRPKKPYQLFSSGVYPS